MQVNQQKATQPNNHLSLCLQPAGVRGRVPGAVGLADGHGRHGNGQSPADDVRGAETSPVQGNTTLHLTIYTITRTHSRHVFIPTEENGITRHSLPQNHITGESVHLCVCEILFCPSHTGHTRTSLIPNLNHILPLTLQKLSETQTYAEVTAHTSVSSVTLLTRCF